MSLRIKDAKTTDMSLQSTIERKNQRYSIQETQKVDKSRFANGRTRALTDDSINGGGGAEAYSNTLIGN